VAGVTPNELRALREQYGSDEQIIAARPDLADAVRALAALSADMARDAAQIRDAFRPPALRTIGDPDESIAPIVLDMSRDHRTELLSEIRDELVAQRDGDAPTSRVGRREGSYIATVETFWAVWKMALDGKSGRGIEEATAAGNKDGLEFVNKTKAGVIVKWVTANRARAKRALGDQKTPRGFLVTPDGVLLPDA
jgi:hypothetical protein